MLTKGVEIELSPKKAEEGAAALIRLRDKLSNQGFAPPRCLGVITANGIAQRRSDEVCLVPVGLLRD